MAWLCGVIAYAGAAAAKKFSRNLAACIAGAVFSSLLYMLKGMTGIFLVTALIILVLKALERLTKEREQKE